MVAPAKKRVSWLIPASPSDNHDAEADCEADVAPPALAPSSKGKAAAMGPTKDKNAPNHNLSSYELWCADACETDELACLGFLEQAKALWAAWTTLTAAEKAPYEAKAKEDKERYERGQAPGPASLHASGSDGPSEGRTRVTG